DARFGDLNPAQLAEIATVAAAFTGLLSLFNIGGRFFWASLSDYIGRKATYFVFFVLGCLLYYSAPSLGRAGSLSLFVAAFCVILTMYGGGFSTIPAYLSDLFGTQMVGAIHGRLLTAWSTAGVLGPVLVNYINDAQIRAGVPRNQAYDTTMYILAAMLVGGFVCNLLVRPVAAKWFMTPEELEIEKRLAHERSAATDVGASHEIDADQGRWILVLLFWAIVAIPLGWGVWTTITKAMPLFR
ncbi:MAG TPA: MFS transporter, partial [Pyrinomonadaceae bacterium]|nr:MFS transporter [Pyrinomonadaceae bacterium]